MTCPRVRVVPPSCTCGRELDITVFHGEDDIGNDLCPTCSGCGCEPNERKNMNKRTPRGVIADAVFAWKDGESLADLVLKSLRYAGYEIIERPVEGEDDDAPVPEPDHSMCARLVRHPDDSANRHGLQSPNGSYLTLPHNGPVFVAPDDYWRERGYAIPEPEPSVEGRAFRALTRFGWLNSPRAVEIIEDGLLVRDGEQ